MKMFFGIIIGLIIGFLIRPYFIKDNDITKDNQLAQLQYELTQAQNQLYSQSPQDIGYEQVQESVYTENIPISGNYYDSDTFIYNFNSNPIYYNDEKGSLVTISGKVLNIETMGPIDEGMDIDSSKMIRFVFGDTFPENNSGQLQDLSFPIITMHALFNESEFNNIKNVVVGDTVTFTGTYKGAYGNGHGCIAFLDCWLSN